MTSLQSIQEIVDRQFYWRFRVAGLIAVCGGVITLSGLCTLPNSYPGQKPRYITSNTYDPDYVSPEQDTVNLRNYQLASTSFKAGISGAGILVAAVGSLIYYNRAYDKEYEKRVARITPAPPPQVPLPIQNTQVTPPATNKPMQAVAKTEVLIPAPNPVAPAPVSAKEQQPVIRQHVKPIEIEEEETSVEYVQPKITPQIPPRAPVRSILKTGSPPLVVNRQNIPAQIPMPALPAQFERQYYQPQPPVRYNNYSLETYRMPHYVPRPPVYAPYNWQYGSYALQPQQSYQRR